MENQFFILPKMGNYFLPWENTKSLGVLWGMRALRGDLQISCVRGTQTLRVVSQISGPIKKVKTSDKETL